MTESGQSGSAATDGASADPVPDVTADAGADPSVLTGPSVTAAPPAPPASETAAAPASETAAAPAVSGSTGGPIVTDPTFTAPPTDYTAAGVPSMDFVRDKIEGRYANALGSAELAEDVLPEVQDMRKKAAEREEAARDKLEAIRRSMRGESSS